VGTWPHNFGCEANFFGPDRFEKIDLGKGSAGPGATQDRRFLTLVNMGILGPRSRLDYHSTTIRGRAELPLTNKQW
jgi:hypothetical protein